MEYIYAYFSDVGTSKLINQDSLCIKTATYLGENIIMAMVCDGMGGNDAGEVASKVGVDAFTQWFNESFPIALKETYGKNEKVLINRCMREWKLIFQKINSVLCSYGRSKKIKTGTTLSVIIIFPMGHFLVGHVGDSRIYRIDRNINMLTEDQSLVAVEVKRGILTEEEAREDRRRNILLECLGISPTVNPLFSKGIIRGKKKGILICSDGFCHEQSSTEIKSRLSHDFLTDMAVRSTLSDMVNNLKIRGEKDNITAIYIYLKFPHRRKMRHV